MGPESCNAIAKDVKKQVEALLGKFLCVSDPAAAATGADCEDGGGVLVDGLPKAGGSSSQCDGGASS